MSEVQEPGTSRKLKPNRFRITSIIIASVMLIGAFGALIGPFTVNVSATAITYGGAGTLDAVWMNNGLVNFTMEDGKFSFKSLYPGVTGQMNHMEQFLGYNNTPTNWQYTTSRSYANYKYLYTTSFAPFSDAYGTGITAKLVYVNGVDNRPNTTFYWSLYADKPLFTWQTKATNNQSYTQNITLESAITTSAMPGGGGVLLGPTTADMYYFRSQPFVDAPNEKYWYNPYPGSIILGGDPGQNPSYPCDQLALITSSVQNIGLVYGLLTANRTPFDNPITSTFISDTAYGISSFNMRSYNHWAELERRNHSLAARATYWGEKFFGCFQQTTNPNKAYEVYSDYLSATQYQRPQVTGGIWGTWYKYWSNYNATNINQTTDYLAANFPEVKYILFDLGYMICDGSRTLCDSTNINTTKFPNFLSVVNHIHSHGMEAVIWFAPLMGTDLNATHPSWSLRDSGGGYIKLTVGGGTYNAMDQSLSAVRTYISNFAANMTSLYGVAGYKYDFSFMQQQGLSKEWNLTNIESINLIYQAINASTTDYLEICQVNQVWSKYANVLRVGPDAVSFSTDMLYLLGIARNAITGRNGMLGSVNFDLTEVGTTPAQNRTVATIGTLVGMPSSWVDMTGNWSDIAVDFINLSKPERDVWVIDLDRSYTGRTYTLPPRIYLLNQSLFGGSGQYTLGVINVENVQRSFTVDLTDAAPSGLYWAYNVWNNSAWMVDSSSFDITLDAYDSALISLTPISSSNVLWSDGKLNSYGAGYVNLDGRYGDETIVIADTNHIWTDAIIYSTSTGQAVQFTSTVVTGVTANLTALSGTLDITPDTGIVISTVAEWSSTSKKWASDSGTGSPTVTFTLSGLESGRMYRLYIDGVSSSLLTASGSGVVSFTYSGPWSEHQFEIVATSVGGSISGLVNLIFIMFGIGIVVGVVAEGTSSLRKMQMRTSQQMIKSLVNMVIYIVIGMASLGVLYSVMT